MASAIEFWLYFAVLLIVAVLIVLLAATGAYVFVERWRRYRSGGR